MRAWGLAFGLRSAGFEKVTLGFAADAVRGKDLPKHNIPGVVSFERSKLAELISDENPDVVVLQHWGLANSLPKLDCPLAIDLAGPHLLERSLWGSKDSLKDQNEKIDALSKADFTVCSGKFQRHYFLPFLIEAGFEASVDLCPVVPFSVAPSLPSASKDRDLSKILHAGFFLPWQDPSKPIAWTLDVMKQRGKGELNIIGGAHPSGDVSAGQYDNLLDEIENHDFATIEKAKPFDELVNVMRQSGVALDLFPQNLERELAFPTRTIIYMWAGLPVIHNNYDELTPLIDEYKAGWTLDPNDEKGLKKILRRILSHPTDLKKRSEGARKLITDKFTWDQTIEPLAEFCKNPEKRKKKRDGVESVRIRSKYYGLDAPTPVEKKSSVKTKKAKSDGNISYSPGETIAGPNRFQQALSPIAMLLAFIFGIVLLVIFSLAEIVRFVFKR